MSFEHPSHQVADPETPQKKWGRLFTKKTRMAVAGAVLTALSGCSDKPTEVVSADTPQTNSGAQEKVSRLRADVDQKREKFEAYHKQKTKRAEELAVLLGFPSDNLSFELFAGVPVKVNGIPVPDNFLTAEERAAIQKKNGILKDIDDAKQRESAAAGSPPHEKPHGAHDPKQPIESIHIDTSPY